MSEVTPLEDIHTVSTEGLWAMLAVYIKNVGVPLKAGSELPVRARVIFKTIEKRLGLHSPGW